MFSNEALPKPDSELNQRSLIFSTRSAISATFSSLKYGILAAGIFCRTDVRCSCLARISLSEPEFQPVHVSFEMKPRYGVLKHGAGPWHGDLGPSVDGICVELPSFCLGFAINVRERGPCGSDTGC
ncbi:hypothetical protein DPMN_005641 [Dreissena polymorpha]|uniref:Uncharacterized protein n=1 Tax=Dreissena polymorpha TaxID=45954 RepID=A0A9D4RUQ6_DREPO|nr:hypothetical protein DPMN_005641 [Dreissena polymorpha]